MFQDDAKSVPDTLLQSTKCDCDGKQYPVKVFLNNVTILYLAKSNMKNIKKLKYPFLRRTFQNILFISSKSC